MHNVRHTSEFTPTSMHEYPEQISQTYTHKLVDYTKTPVNPVTPEHLLKCFLTVYR